MTQTRLVDLAQEDRLEELEAAWTAAIADPGDPATYAKTLKALCERDLSSRALELAQSMIEALSERDRADEAFDIGMTLVRCNAHSDALAKRLFDLVQQRFAKEAWYPMVSELTALGADSLSGEALESFDKMRRYTKGHVVYHRGGWGEGLVTEFNANDRELTIEFANGRVREVPLSTAIDSMTPLAPDDLRAMLLTQREELERLMTEEPSILIRKCAKVYRGRVTSSEVKQMLSPALIPTKKWATFWKKAKAAAAVDPYLQVEGSTTRPAFELRRRPLSLAEETEQKLKHCDDLGEEIALIREFLERTSDESTRATILDLAQQRTETAAQQQKAPHAHILEGILLLEQHERSHPETNAATELRAMLLSEEDASLQPNAFDLLQTQDARQHAVRLLPDALGEDWATHCISQATRFPANVVEGVVQLLVEKKQAADLITLWPQIAPYPRRHPMMTYLIGRAYADDVFKDRPEDPGEVAVARVLLHLARVLASMPRSNTTATRLLTRVASLLCGRRNFLQDLLERITRDDLANYLGICERGGNDFPQEITDVILRAVARRFPDLTAKPEKPFWDEDAIYVTRAGLESKRTEYSRLTNDLIPANAKAIGAAAELGDLSENSEWEAAMEEQRNLTGRATMMDQDLRKAKLLEEINIPKNVVAPGTEVTFVRTDTGESRTVKVLGPWDASDDESVLNYLAPAAQPLLGKKVGATAELPSERGVFEVRIEKIDAIL